MTDKEKDNSLRRRMKIVREREQFWNDKWHALLRQRVELDYDEEKETKDDPSS
jgi:DNA-binding transcriptional regulator PaaX